jgi:hypothetical protein
MPGADTGWSHQYFDPSWSADSTHVYCANYNASGGKPALWRIGAEGGKPEVVIASQPGGEQVDLSNAREINGKLYAFVAKFKNSAFMPTYSMQRFKADGSAPEKLRDDAYDANAVTWSLWAPDGSGAVVQVAEEGQPANALIWARRTGAAPVALGSRAFGQPQWGPTQS